ncbi:MAG TPA: ATP-binding protein [Thermomicrobiales bacterium]|nr:ATP-binding protein [Thermomicrobiales bacterium]
MYDDTFESTALPVGRPTLAVICGLPATGKSTLAGELHKETGWPLLSKDEFKELLFDAGEHDHETFTRTQSMVIGRQALALLFRVARQFLEADHNCIVEANFLPHLASADFDPLRSLADIRQIHCVVPDAIVLARYRERAEAGRRHRVHIDVEAGKELVVRLKDGAGQPLPLTGSLLQVDTTDGYQPNLCGIVDFLAR